MSALQSPELHKISLPDNRGWRWEEYPDPGMRRHGRFRLQQPSLPILVSTTSKNLSSRLQPLANNWSFVCGLLLLFCLQPPMSGCPQICSLLWAFVFSLQPLIWMTVLAYADFMNACLIVSLMNSCPSVCSLSQVVVYCICLQPLMNRSYPQPLTVGFLLSAASHKWLSTGPPVCSLSWTTVLLSAASYEQLSCYTCSLWWMAVLLSEASHKWLSTISVCRLSWSRSSCLQPFTSIYLLYLSAASHN